MKEQDDKVLFDYDHERGWFIISTKIGYENYVKDSLEKMKETRGLSATLGEMFIPYEDEEKKHKVYPGYIFANAIMTTETWFAIRNTRYVFGFIGSSGKGAKPIPVPEADIEQLKARCGIHEIVTDLKVGESVKILTGPFEGVVCKVVNTNGDKLIVSTTMFNQEKEIEVDLKDVIREEV